MFENFTHAAREAVVQAQLEARNSGAFYLRPEHLLLALLTDPAHEPGDLKKLKLVYADVREELYALAPPEGPPYQGQIPVDQKVKDVLQTAIDLARKQGHRHTGTEHLLAALLELTEGPVAQVIRDASMPEPPEPAPRRPVPRSRPSGLAERILPA
jgi:ATP-dependent Clp protease ATP-binding subunit ClpA